MGIRFAIVSVLLWGALLSGLRAEEPKVRIYIVGHGWHTGLVIPFADVDLEMCPGLRYFEGWDFVEIGWGDEGFYRGADSISLDVALAAVFTPTPTVLHIVGVNAPVHETFSMSEVIHLDLERENFMEMLQFIAATFRMKSGTPEDLGEGIYGFSRFFRAEGSYYFPNTCNVWTLKALKAAGFPVIPAAGIRTENVLDQAAKYGTTIRRYSGRSRLLVLGAFVLALIVGWKARKTRRLVLWAWSSLILAVVAISAVTMMAVNQIQQPDWLPVLASFLCWAAVAFVSFAHFNALRNRIRWRHLVPAVLALLVVLIGLSPL